ncbi:MAG: MbnP family protein, partial [Bacteroidia bacterium]
VDSFHNCSGAQSGALDPVNAMYWAWNTGYIFLKLEGASKFSKSPGNFFEYHIGGYKQPNNNIRKVSFTFDPPIKTEQQKPQALNFKVNVLELLKTPTAIDFEKFSSITDLRNANTVADNYSDMFELIK